MMYRVLSFALAASVWLCGCQGPGGEPGTGQVVLPSGDKVLSSFVFDPADNPGLAREVRAEIAGSSVTAILPPATAVHALVPRLTHTGVSVSPDSAVPQDFTQPVAYTVVAADGSSAQYRVVVVVEASSTLTEPPVITPPPPAARSATRVITAFSLAGVSAHIEGDSIQLSLPAGTDLNALTPQLSWQGASISPDERAAQSFSEPVTYTVTAQDGSTRSYVVSVTLLPSATKDITRFSIAGVLGDIAGDEIRLTVPFGTRISFITPKLEHNGVSISPVVGTLSDFTKPVVFTVTAEDGSQRQYTVRVEVASNLAKEITHFTVFGIDALISDSTIELTLPYGTSPESLSPVITLSGGTVEPESGVERDFTQPVEYTVTGQDGTTHMYTAVVVIAPSNANHISAFQVPGAAAIVSGDNIKLWLPYGADASALMPTVVHAGVSVQPQSGVTQDFTQPVVYTVVAADGGKRSYTVTTSWGETSGRGIVRFSALGCEALIRGDEIALTLPNGANLTALSPEILHYGARLTPGSGLAQNFSVPVKYNLLELDGQLHAYTVRAQRAASSDTTLVGVSVLGYRARIVGDQVSVDLPYGTALNALAPSVTHLGARVSPVSGTTRDLTHSVVYTVIAADGGRHDYTLSARAAASDEKRLTDFALLGVPGSIAGDQVAITLPAGTDARALRPTFVQHNGASLQPPAAQIRDFTQPVGYTVTAADGSSAEYVVRVTVEEP